MTIRRVPLRPPLPPPLRLWLPGRLPGLLSAVACAAVACAAVVLSGCGSQPFGPQPGSQQPGSQQPGGARTGTAGPRTTGPASPQQRAVADAARSMASFPRPPGAVRAGPIASLTQPGARPATPDLASVTRWWRVPGRPQEVLAWVGAHLPPGFAPAGTGSGSGSWTGMFALPAVPGVLTQRELVVLAVRSGSQTAIRVDAQVVWLPARPGAERVPPTAAVLTVTPVFGLNPDRRGERLDRAFTVTDPAQVARIAAIVNGLTRFPAGAFSCPVDSGGQMRLTFSTRPGGPVLARLTLQYGGCGIVSVRIGGRDMPALSEYPRSGPPLPQQVLAIADVSWPVEPGSAS